MTHDLEDTDSLAEMINHKSQNKILETFEIQYYYAESSL